MQPISSTNNEFDEIITIIEQARQRAFRAVNRELIEMYWQIGQYISEKVKSNAWGKSVVLEFAKFVQSKYVGIGFFGAKHLAHETVLRDLRWERKTLNTVERIDLVQ